VWWFVVRRLVWRCLISRFLRCSFNSYWRSIIQSKIWASTLQIRRHE